MVLLPNYRLIEQLVVWIRILVDRIDRSLLAVVPDILQPYFLLSSDVQRYPSMLVHPADARRPPIGNIKIVRRQGILLIDVEFFMPVIR